MVRNGICPSTEFQRGPSVPLCLFVFESLCLVSLCLCASKRLCLCLSPCLCVSVSACLFVCVAGEANIESQRRRHRDKETHRGTQTLRCRNPNTETPRHRRRSAETNMETLSALCVSVCCVSCLLSLCLCVCLCLCVFRSVFLHLCVSVTLCLRGRVSVSVSLSLCLPFCFSVCLLFRVSMLVPGLSGTSTGKPFSDSPHSEPSTSFGSSSMSLVSFKHGFVSCFFFFFFFFGGGGGRKWLPCKTLQKTDVYPPKKRDPHHALRVLALGFLRVMRNRVSRSHLMNPGSSSSQLPSGLLPCSFFFLGKGSPLNPPNKKGWPVGI